MCIPWFRCILAYLTLCKLWFNVKTTNNIPADMLYRRRMNFCVSVFGFKILATLKRVRMFMGINSAQYFSHWRGTSELLVNEVQSKMMSNEQEWQEDEVNICQKRLEQFDEQYSQNQTLKMWYMKSSMSKLSTSILDNRRTKTAVSS